MDQMEKLIKQNYIGKEREQKLEQHNKRKWLIEKNTRAVSSKTARDAESMFDNYHQPEKKDWSSHNSSIEGIEQLIPITHGLKILMKPGWKILPGGEIKYVESHS